MTYQHKTRYSTAVVMKEDLARAIEIESSYLSPREKQTRMTQMKTNMKRG